MASFASSATTGGARKHAWTKTMASFASSATMRHTSTPGPIIDNWDRLVIGLIWVIWVISVISVILVKT